MKQASGQRTYLVQAARTYHEQLMTRGPDSIPAGALDFLRGHLLNSRDTLSKYRIGYVAEPLPGDARFTGMISLPYLVPSGSVAALKFRDLSGGGAGKYAQHRGQQVRLFNTQAWFDAGDAIGIAEGEADAIVATEHLGLPTVGIPGATNWDARLWRPLFKDYQQVVLWADGDGPGREMADKLEEEIGWRALIVNCPDGEDVSSMVAAGRGDELLRQWRSTSNPEAS